MLRMTHFHQPKREDYFYEKKKLNKNYAPHIDSLKFLFVNYRDNFDELYFRDRFVRFLTALRESIEIKGE